MGTTLNWLANQWFVLSIISDIVKAESGVLRISGGLHALHQLLQSRNNSDKLNVEMESWIASHSKQLIENYFNKVLY